MASHVLLIVSILFGLFQVFKIKDKFARVITLIFVVSAGATLIPSPMIQQDAFYLFGFSHLAIFFYVFHNEEFALKKKLILAAMSLLQLISITFLMMHWPHIGLVLLLGSGTIILFIIALLTDIKSYKNEIGFMTILAAFGVINLMLGFRMTFILDIP